MPEKDLLLLTLQKIGGLFFAKPTEKTRPIVAAIREEDGIIAKHQAEIEECRTVVLPEFRSKLALTQTSLATILSNPNYVNTYGGQEGFDEQVAQFKQAIITKKDEIRLITNYIVHLEKEIDSAEKQKATLVSQKVAIDLEAQKNTYRMPRYFLQIRETLGESPSGSPSEPIQAPAELTRPSRPA